MQPAKLPSEYRSYQWSFISRSISIVTGKIYEHKNRQGLFVCSIIESVDSNVGIARTRNIWQYKKISQNLKNGQLISLYNNVPFIFDCFNDQQVVRESIAKVPNQELAKQAKQGRDDHIKQSSIQTPYISFFVIHVLWKKIPVGG